MMIMPIAFAYHHRSQTMGVSRRVPLEALLQYNVEGISLHTSVSALLQGECGNYLRISSRVIVQKIPTLSDSSTAWRDLTGALSRMILRFYSTVYVQNSGRRR